MKDGFLEWFGQWGRGLFHVFARTESPAPVVVMFDEEVDDGDDDGPIGILG